jgi:hypothetical protein
MIFPFSIIVDVLAINDKHTLPVKTCQQLDFSTLLLKGVVMKLMVFELMIQVDISGHPPSPTRPKHVSGNFGNLLFLAVFNFRGHFEALNDVF